jgi:uncharacterized protein YqhQ
MAEHKHNYGGQAVIEGVMIRGQKAVVTAVRRPSGGIKVTGTALSALYTGRWRRMPLVRGVIVLLESMILGIKSLLLSADVALEEEEEEITPKAIFIMMASAILVAVAVFFLTPLFLTDLVNRWIPNAVVFNLVEGAVRLIIFLAYLKIMGMMPDIKRVFSYHGAEHKTVNAYEAGVPMEVDEVQKFGTAHVRCGTSFLFLVLVIAIFVFSLVGRPALWIMVISRVLLLPVIAALGYEVIYLTAKYTDNRLVKIIQWPGLALQSMTTAEPTGPQVEVAIAAMQRAVAIDEGLAPEAEDEADVEAEAGPAPSETEPLGPAEPAA